MSGQKRRKILDNAALVRTIKRYLVVPFSATCNINAWCQDEHLSYYHSGDNDYKRAVSTACRQTSSLTFDQILDTMEAAGSNAHYYSRSSSGYYLSLEDSEEVVIRLLRSQYKDGWVNFLQRLWNVCEKAEGKKNSMFILGDPNSGKSFFFDMVCAFHLNVGHVKNFNKNTSFPLNDCVNKRILLWNEPNIETAAFDTVKMLLGGDPLPADVKFESNNVISRTPVILTSNSCPFNKDNAVWTSRIYFEPTWRSQPWLQDVHGYPHPRTYANIMVKYVL